MGGKILIKIDVFKELKALLILIFIGSSLFFVREELFLAYLILISAFTLILNFYIKINDLVVSKQIFLIFISLINVFSLAFVIQYLLRGEINSKLLELVFASFLDKANGLYYVGWLFVMTFGILVNQTIGGGDSGR